MVIYGYLWSAPASETRIQPRKFLIKIRAMFCLGTNDPMSFYFQSCQSFNQQFILIYQFNVFNRIIQNVVPHDSQSTHIAREQSDFIILSEPKILCLVNQRLIFICQFSVLNQIIQNVVPHDSCCCPQAKQPGLALAPV